MSNKNHTWKNSYIGHSTYGPVCTECNVDYLTGMSDLGCPNQRLWLSHWLPDNKQVNFTEPTEVEVDYTFVPCLVLPNTKDCLGGTISCFRDGKLIKQYSIPGTKCNHKLNTLTYYGNSFPTCFVTPIKHEVKNPKIVFTDLFETTKPAQVSDYQYRFNKYEAPEVLETI